MEEERKTVIIIRPFNDGVMFFLSSIYTQHTSYFNFRFSNEGICEKCHSPVEDLYLEIIEGLKKAGLLAEDYPMLCCDCFINKRSLKL